MTTEGKAHPYRQVVSEPDKLKIGSDDGVKHDEHN